MNNIINQLKEAGYSYGVAIATESEIENNAACGQLGLVFDEQNKMDK